MLFFLCLFHATYDLLNYFTAALFPEFYVQFWLYLIGMAVVMVPIMALSRPVAWVARVEKAG